MEDRTLFSISSHHVNRSIKCQINYDKDTLCYIHGRDIKQYLENEKGLMCLLGWNRGGKESDAHEEGVLESKRGRGTGLGRWKWGM